nr:hypothetical protein [Actinomycetota bacterium]
VRRARQVESPRAGSVTREASLALARGMALNQLGTADPPAPALTALLGFLGLFEVALDEWLAGTITREQLEQLVAEALPAVAAAGDRAGRGESA